MNPRSRRVLLSLLALAAALLLAGNQTAAFQPGDPVSAARQHLIRNAQRLGLSADLHDLREVSVRQSLSGQHVRFQQTINGIAVFGGDVTVSLPKGHAPFVLSRYRSGPSATVDAVRLDRDAAIAAAGAAVIPEGGGLRGEVAVEPVYFDSGARYVRAWQLVVPTADPVASWLVVLRADTGEVLLKENLLRFDSGRVFDPNPAKSSGGSIPPPTDCDSSANESLLAGQYQTRTLLGIQSGQNKLKGEFVDLTAPGITGAYKTAGQADEASRSYVYPCSNDRFEEVMVYRHIDAVQRKIQSLGFSGASDILDHAIPAHAHYFNDCNAFYDPVDRGLHFGDSGASGCSRRTDAGEDADVIVHEYGHAIQDNQVPGWGFGSASVAEQAWAMGEGFGDFLAGAIYGDPCLAEWFNIANNNCGGSPGLRTLDNTKHYPEDYDACRPFPPPGQPAEPHCAGLIWGGALWDLVEAFGNDQAARDLALTLVLDSQFYLDPVSTFAEAAAAIRLVDTILFKGAHVATIDSVFSARGISDTGPVTDFPYAYLRILHPNRGDLEINLKTGSLSSPLCSVDVWNPNQSDHADDLVGYEDLSSPPGSACAPYLPPTTAQPWYLEVRDVATPNVGTIEEFEIVLPGPERCVATDIPIAIPEGGGFVHSQVDCSTVAGPYPASDLDGDGFAGAVEASLATGPLDPCGNDGWPADLDPNNALDIGDLNGFIMPIREDGSFNKFGHTVPDPDDPVLARWDLTPDSLINISDLNSLNPAVTGSTARPPMFGGQPAFFKVCPFAP